MIFSLDFGRVNWFAKSAITAALASPLSGGGDTFSLISVSSSFKGNIAS
jgi:hypothetical protein